MVAKPAPERAAPHNAATAANCAPAGVSASMVEGSAMQSVLIHIATPATHGTAVRRGCDMMRCALSAQTINTSALTTFDNKKSGSTVTPGIGEGDGLSQIAPNRSTQGIRPCPYNEAAVRL